jgi:protein O-mannosyl-transferase
MKEPGRSLSGGCTVIVLLTITAYLPALHGGFIWDDDDHLTKNPAMLSVEGLKQIWSSPAVARYYPLTLTSFWVQRRFWGLQPLPYHAVNIALQAVNAVLLWRLLRRLQVRGAWVAAALWAVHPVNVETVAWVTELKNTQSGLFFLLALLVFLRFEDGLRPRDYVLALGSGAAAMLSKPSTVVLPGVMLLCAWWRRGRWTRKDLVRVAPLVAFAVGMSFVAIVEQRHNIEGGGASGWALTVAQRLVLAGRVVWFYAAKLLWPTGICFIYPRWELRVDSVVAWLPLAGLALVAVTLWRFRRAGWARSATFGLGCFVLALLPVLGFFNIYFFRYSFVADHFQYLASIGWIALVVSASAAIAQRAGERGRDVGVLASAVVLLLLAVCTWRQTHVYYSLETLWGDALAKNPNAWLAHNNLGVASGQAGRLQEAIGHFEQALRIKPDYAEAHYNLGNALSQEGKLEDAIGHWEQAVRIKPGYAEAHYNLGGTLARLGKVQEAIMHFEQALRIKPDDAEAHYNLGTALVRVGRVQEAMGHWEQAVKIKPDYAEAHYDLGVALVGLRRVQEAMGHWEQALKIKPDYAEAHYNLGVALEQAGKIQEAIGHFEQALKIKPGYAEARAHLQLARQALAELQERAASGQR